METKKTNKTEKANKMDIKKYVDYFNLHNSFEFDLYELLSSLIYARLVNPCSKHRTFHEVLPQLRDGVHFSYDQLLDGLEFIGNDYGKFIEIFNEQTKKFYDINTSKTYFDCSNFYLEEKVLLKKTEKIPLSA